MSAFSVSAEISTPFSSISRRLPASTVTPERTARIPRPERFSNSSGLPERSSPLFCAACTLSLIHIFAEKFQGLRPIVCANLPYNITTPVLTKFVETPAIETVTVLIQKEVAQRLAAPQGSADGGAFSLYLQYYMETSCLFDVPREKFLPSPKVTSAVLRCVRREKPAVEVADKAFFFKVIKGAFLLRRKTLVNSLSLSLIHISGSGSSPEPAGSPGPY